MAGEAASRTSLTLAFQRRRDAEWRKLRQHLHLQLQHDIARIFTNSVYCDLELVFKSTTIHTHRSVLQVRASRFFTKLCTIPASLPCSVVFEKASVDFIKSFIRNIYSRCAIEEEELDVVQYLDELNEPVNATRRSVRIPCKVEREGSNDSGLSPESDVYLTPNCSPSEFYSGFDGHHAETLNIPAPIVESRNEPTLVNSSSSNNLHHSYYSLVPVDEVFREESCLEPATKSPEVDVLERELAEQDELLKSFRSIKSKEEKKTNNIVKKLKKPTSLPFSSSHYAKKQKRGCDIIVGRDKPSNKKDSKQISNETIKQCSNAQEVVSRREKPFLEKFDFKNSALKEESGSLLCCFSCKGGVLASKAKQNDFFNEEEEEEFMCSPADGADCGLDCCKKEEEFLTFPCSPEMDASGGGPDSGLDTSSTGCIPGGGFSSPREHTVSETSGVDLTEAAAIGEDMPHDGELQHCDKNEKSSASSSVSSDAGTWDSTFPPANGGSVESKQTATCESFISKCHENKDVPSKDKRQEKEILPRTPRNSPDESKSKPSKTEEIQPCDTSIHKSSDVKEKLNKKPVDDAPDLAVSDFDMGRSESYSRKMSSLNDLQTDYFVDSQQPSSGEKCTKWRIDSYMGGGNNYFINAATLVDDSELPASLPPLYIHEVGFKEKEDHSTTSEQRVSRSSSSSPCRFQSEVSETKKTGDKDNSPTSNFHTVSSGEKELDAGEIEELAPRELDASSDKKLLEDSGQGDGSAAKCTHLKVAPPKQEQKIVNGRGIVAEFEKEIKLTEHVEPQPLVRKIHLERRRWDSCSDDSAYRDESDSSTGRKDLESKTKLPVKQKSSESVGEEIITSESSPSGDETLSTSKPNQFRDVTADGEMKQQRDGKESEKQVVGESDYVLKENRSCTSNVKLEADIPVAEGEISEDTIEKNEEEEEEAAEGPRRPSLIRRNTFELDPDDDRLALLRQEYERRQGKLLFQNCIPQFSGHITGSEGFRDVQSMLVIGSNSEEINLVDDLQKSLPSIPVDSLDPTSLDVNFDKSPIPLSRTYSGHHMPHGPVSLFSERPLASLYISEQTSVNDLSEGKSAIPTSPEEEDDDDEVSERIKISDDESRLDGKNPQDLEPPVRMTSSYDNSSRPVISGALTCSDLVLEEKNPWDSPKKQKRTESTPIVSGGVSSEDFSVAVRRVTESPVMRRKNESAPILSGAAPVSPPKEPKKEETRPSLAGVSAWVVDMSDCSGKPPLDLRRHRKSDSVAESPDKASTQASKNSDSKTVPMGYFVDFKDSSGKYSEPKDPAHEAKIVKNHESLPASVGYFVGLEESKPHPKSKWEKKSSSFEEPKESCKRQSSKTEEARLTGKNSPCGFFVDFIPADSGGTSKKDTVDEKKHPEEDSGTPDKKNALFSMFIDIGDSKQDSSSKLSGSTESVRCKVASSPLLSAQKKLVHRRASLTRGETIDKGSRITSATFDLDDEPPKSSFMFIDASAPPVSKQISTSSQSSSQDEVREPRENKKQGFFMFIETESPVTRRKTLPSGLRPNFNRHSWNPDSRNNLQTEEIRISSRRQHKRAHSLSVDRSSLGSPGDEHRSSSSSSLAKSRMQGSSQSLHESNSISEDLSTHPPMSSSCHARLSSKCHDKFVKRAVSVEGKIETEIRTISESNDVDTQVRDATPVHKIKTSGDVDIKFAVQESNVGFLRISDFEHAEEFTVSKVVQVPVHDRSIILEEKSSITEKHIVRKLESKESLNKSDNTRTLSKTTINNANEDIASGGKESQTKKDGGSFVKLSDLDKEPVKTDFDDTVLPSFASANRMTRSIPETSWIENKLLMTRSIGGGTTSRSLSRLFPHLHTTMMATSSPSSLSHTKSPSTGQMDADDNDTQMSETSDLSSMQSSMGPSGLEGSTEETDASSSYAGRSGPVSRLGEDLLRMFLEEINPDVTVEVGGRRLKAHKCILSSRCQYFAAMLSGGWVESAGNVISLQGFSYNAVHFALCHIYSGTSNIPDSISIVELATLADMLGLEGLKEVIMYTLKVKYCHFFHKPCTMCAVGVLECLPLAAAYGLDDIYRKSLRWITKYFVRIWPTKGFASLPRELIDKCYQQHVVHMSVDNILETVMSCDKLLATLPSVRWAEPVFGITSQLLEASIKFIANNFSGVLTSSSFMSLGKELSWNISRLEDSIMAATDRLPPEQACQSHARLHGILTAAQSAEPPPDMQWSPTFVELLSRIQKRVEASLVRQAPRAARCQSWGQIEPELRKKIQEAACLVLVPGEEGHRSRHASLSRRAQGSSSGTNSVYCTGPRSISSGSRNLDLRQVKLAMTQQARRAASGGRVSTLRADSKAKQPKQPSAAAAKHGDTKAASNGETGTTSTGRPKTWPMRVLETKSRSSKYRANLSDSSTGTPEKSAAIPRRAGKTMISSSDSSRTSSPAMRRSTPGSEGSGGRGRTSTNRSLTNCSETPPPNREVRSSRRRREGEASTMSTDSLTESPSNGKRCSETLSTSKSCISTRPDTPSVRRRVREEVVMSTDSLASVANGEKATGKEGTSVSAPNISSIAARPDTPKERARNALGRLGIEVTMSTDSLATDSSYTGDTAGSGRADDGKSPKLVSNARLDGKSAVKLGKVSGTRCDNQQRSPAAAVRRSTRQSIISPRDSPTAKLRSTVSSSPYTGSPSLRRSLLLASKCQSDNNNISKQATPTKVTTISKPEKVAAKLLASPSASSKRTPTRLQTNRQIVASPGKMGSNDGMKTSSSGKALSSTGGSAPGKTHANANKVNNNMSVVKKNSTNGKNKRNADSSSSEDKPPTVGSRSGTFLKDEPTILKKPEVDNVQE
ncbi:streptococcal hemagglutinin [Anabrus simplex]|uniref:streptococcal hemagglutinin n=1 Tax=Anabrus simplex TaxID=316456 RepID=UPI0035A2E589